MRRTKGEFSQFGSRAGIHRVDLSKKEEIDALWDHLEGEEPDILVNNAGVFPFRGNFLLPGGIVTPGTKAVARELLKFRIGLITTGCNFGARPPLNRAGRPDDVARRVLVLASGLSSYVQGAMVPVDGGFLSACVAGTRPAATCPARNPRDVRVPC